MADERCPYAHGPLVAVGAEIKGRQGVDEHGHTYASIMVCPQCGRFLRSCRCP